MSDSARIQEHLDGWIFVIRARRAPREAILGGFARLQKEKIVGVVFNDMRQMLSTNYYHYGYSAYKTRR